MDALGYSSLAEHLTKLDTNWPRRIPVRGDQEQARETGSSRVQLFSKMSNKHCSGFGACAERPEETILREFRHLPFLVQGCLLKSGIVEHVYVCFAIGVPVL